MRGTGLATRCGVTRLFLTCVLVLGLGGTSHAVNPFKGLGTAVRLTMEGLGRATRGVREWRHGKQPFVREIRLRVKDNWNRDAPGLTRPRTAMLLLGQGIGTTLAVDDADHKTEWDFFSHHALKDTRTRGSGCAVFLLDQAEVDQIVAAVKPQDVDEEFVRQQLQHQIETSGLPRLGEVPLHTRLRIGNVVLQVDERPNGRPGKTFRPDWRGFLESVLGIESSAAHKLLFGDELGDPPDIGRVGLYCSILEGGSISKQDTITVIQPDAADSGEALDDVAADSPDTP